MEKKKLDTSYINKAIHKIENIFELHPIKNDKGEIEGEQSRLDQLGYDNSDGYSATRDLRAFLKFYKTLDEYSRYLLRTKLVVKTGYDINDIKKYLDLSNDGGEFTPEYYNYWINSLYESVNNKDKFSNKYIKSFREAVEKLEEDDGNPGLLQAIDYDMDNDQMKHDDRFWNLMRKVQDVYVIAYDLYREYEDNKKLKKVKDLLYDADMYLSGERNKNLDRNEFVSTSHYNHIEPEYDFQNADYDYLNK